MKQCLERERQIISLPPPVVFNVKLGLLASTVKRLDKFFMAVTIHDIARELNLSAMTVSRVLGRGDNVLVKPDTRQRVEEAALRLGYRPNRNARALASGRTHVIGLWISHLQSSVYSQIVQACRLEVQGAGMEISISEMDWHFHSSNSRPRFEWPVDGVLAVDPPSQTDLKRLLQPDVWNGIPRVHLGSGQGVPWEGDYALVDLGEGTRTAVEHLMRVGCRRIAYVVPKGADFPGMCQYDVYISALQSAGLRPELIVVEDWECATVRRAVVDHVRSHGHPDGVFCHHDEFAIAAFRALRDLNLHVPNDVALIGCEGNAFLEYFDPPISTIAMPIPDLCRTAWRLLQRRLEETESLPQGITLPFAFLSRASSR